MIRHVSSESCPPELGDSCKLHSSSGQEAQAVSQHGRCPCQTTMGRVKVRPLHFLEHVVQPCTQCLGTW